MPAMGNPDSISSDILRYYKQTMTWFAEILFLSPVVTPTSFDYFAGATTPAPCGIFHTLLSRKWI
jgi:hypothetical protein